MVPIVPNNVQAAMEADSVKSTALNPLSAFVSKWPLILSGEKNNHPGKQIAPTRALGGGVLGAWHPL